jgi:hypothetical protein
MRDGVFRSLEVAFQANRFPSDGLSSINDIGTRIGLWVSAFEVLFHRAVDDRSISGSYRINSNAFGYSIDAYAPGTIPTAPMKRDLAMTTATGGGLALVAGRVVLLVLRSRPRPTSAS